MLDMCDGCGKEIQDFDDVGYMGDSDRSSNEAGECNPFLRFTTLCNACEAEYQKKKGKT